MQTIWVLNERITCLVDIQPHIGMTRMVCNIEAIRNIYIQNSKWVVGLVDVYWNCFQRGGSILLFCWRYGPGLGHLTVAERVAWGMINLSVLAHMYGLQINTWKKLYKSFTGLKFLGALLRVINFWFWKD